MRDKRQHRPLVCFLPLVFVPDPYPKDVCLTLAMPATPENTVRKDKDKKEVSVAQGALSCWKVWSQIWLLAFSSQVLNVISCRFFSPLISGWRPFFRAQICSLLKLRTLPKQISMSNDSMDSQCDSVVGQNPPDLQNASMKTTQKNVPAKRYENPYLV